MRLGYHVLNNFRNLNSLVQSLGARWLMFRIGYALRLRTGLVRRQMPAYQWRERPLATWLKNEIPSRPEAYAEWRRQNSPRFFFDSLDQRIAAGAGAGQGRGMALAWDPQLAVEEAERVLSGELKYFAHRYVKTGFPPDWHRDPVSGKRVDARKHWSEISNEGDLDIKFIWEASRFSMVYTLVRAYTSTRDPKFAEAFWELIEDWAEGNPPNTGPNWMDGQEAALRLMAWTFGFHAFLDSPATTSERMAQFTVMIAAHAERIHKNIGYAISTHSNHTISEASGLWLVGLMFPELKEADKYSALGRTLLEQEAAAQIFPDGTYSMYSLNYHRFVLHIYLFAIRLGEMNGSPFSERLKSRVARSVNYLYELIDPESGQMPLYGSNDGALVLLLNNCDFTDYRPLLQLGSFLMKKELLFEPGPWDEDLFWVCGEAFPSAKGRPRSASEGGVRGEGEISFPHGGTYLLRGADSKVIIRCTDYRSRPSHADQLHVDLWWRGINIACDAGTYLYSGEGVWRNGLARTSVHNTVTVDGRDQMNMVSRFTWTDWAKGMVLRHNDEVWQGQHDGYRRLADPVKHRRTVLSLGVDRWLVIDHLTGKRPHHYALHWLLRDGEYGVRELAPAKYGISLAISDSKLPDSKLFIQLGLVKGNGSLSVVRGDENNTRGWRSPYYGHKEPAISALLETDQVQTLFWTYFGSEDDIVEMEGKTFNLVSHELSASISLQSLAL